MEQENGTKKQTAVSGLGAVGLFGPCGVADFARLGHRFFMRSGSRILRAGDGEKPHRVRLLQCGSLLCWVSFFGAMLGGIMVRDYAALVEVASS